MKKNNKILCISTVLLLAFLLWTIAVSYIDTEAIGPRDSEVGFSSLNQFVHQLTDVHLTLYTITDWLSLIPFFICLGFGILGLMQWIKRKSLSKVDADLFVLGGFYLIVIAVYLFFESFTINYRPILIYGYLETSYPSSTTMLVLCVMPTAMMQLNNRIKNESIKSFLRWTIMLFTVFMVVGRLISGVHWVTDIIGGILLSAGLVMMYYAVCEIIKVKTDTDNK